MRKKRIHKRLFKLSFTGFSFIFLTIAAGCLNVNKSLERASIGQVSSTLIQRAWSQYKKGSLNSAEKDFQRAAILNPESSHEASLGAGWCMVRTNRCDEAMASLMNAEESASRNIGIAYALIQRRSTGDLDEAINILNDFLYSIDEYQLDINKIGIGEASIHAMISLAYLWRGENVEGELHLLKAKQANIHNEYLVDEIESSIKENGF